MQVMGAVTASCAMQAAKAAVLGDGGRELWPAAASAAAPPRRLPACRAPIRYAVAEPPRREALQPAAELPTKKKKQQLQSRMKLMMTQEKIEMFESLQQWAEQNVLPHLKPVEKSWQPQDFLPEPSSDDFHDAVAELRRRCRHLPSAYLVCLVGDMITEEALPSYQSLLNSLDGVADRTGSSPLPWARWIRGWTAEENRHGDLLHKYLYLSGRVDMRSVQKTIHYLISTGMDRKVDDNPYLGFIYASFQERATFISHGNTARQAKQYGDLKLAQICGIIASDEKRHEHAYQKIVEKLFELDPEGTMLCFEDIMRKRVLMPACLMYDGLDKTLYDKFSLVAQQTGVYTARDYADILDHLIKRWNVEKMSGLSSRGQQAQDYICSLGARVRTVEERIQSNWRNSPSPLSFSWIFNKEVDLQ